MKVHIVKILNLIFDTLASHTQTYSLEFPSPSLKGGNKQSKVNEMIEKAVIGCDAIKI